MIRQKYFALLLVLFCLGCFVQKKKETSEVTYNSIGYLVFYQNEYLIFIKSNLASSGVNFDHLVSKEGMVIRGADTTVYKSLMQNGMKYKILDYYDLNEPKKGQYTNIYLAPVKLRYKVYTNSPVLESNVDFAFGYDGKDYFVHSKDKEQVSIIGIEFLNL